MSSSCFPGRTRARLPYRLPISRSEARLPKRFASWPTTDSSQRTGFLVAKDVPLRLESLTLSGQGSARAVRAEGASVTMLDVVLRDGGMLGNGSLLYADVNSTITLRSVTLVGGDAGRGSGGLVAIDGVLDAIGSRFQNGLTERRGGALFCGPTSRCSVQDSLFVNNVAGDGGAVFLQGSAGPWRRNRFCGNDALGSETQLGRGGAAWSDGTVIHQNSVFQANRAVNAGGALFSQAGALAVLNSDFLGNVAMVEGAAIAALSDVPVELRNTLVAFSTGSADRAIASDSPEQSVEYSAFYANEDMTALGRALTPSNQPAGQADPRIRYVEGDCVATDVLPRTGSTLIDAGDPFVLDPDESRSDIGSTGGPWACNRRETPGNEIDEDCDGIELCYADADGDGFGEPDAALVVSEDLDCTGEGEAPRADDVCLGHDDRLDCDNDGIPDGCDQPCTPPELDIEVLRHPLRNDTELLGGAGCACSGPSAPIPLTWSGPLLLLLGLMRRRGRLQRTQR